MIHTNDFSIRPFHTLMVLTIIITMRAHGAELSRQIDVNATIQLMASSLQSYDPCGVREALLTGIYSCKHDSESPLNPENLVHNLLVQSFYKYDGPQEYRNGWQRRCLPIIGLFFIRTDLPRNYTLVRYHDTLQSYVSYSFLEACLSHHCKHEIGNTWGSLGVTALDAAKMLIEQGARLHYIKNGSRNSVLHGLVEALIVKRRTTDAGSLQYVVEALKPAYPTRDNDEPCAFAQDVSNINFKSGILAAVISQKPGEQRLLNQEDTEYTQSLYQLQQRTCAYYAHVIKNNPGHLCDTARLVSENQHHNTSAIRYRLQCMDCCKKPAWRTALHDAVQDESLTKCKALLTQVPATNPHALHPNGHPGTLLGWAKEREHVYRTRYQQSAGEQRAKLHGKLQNMKKIRLELEIACMQTKVDDYDRQSATMNMVF